MNQQDILLKYFKDAQGEITAEDLYEAMLDVDKAEFPGVKAVSDALFKMRSRGLVVNGEDQATQYRRKPRRSWKLPASDESVELPLVEEMVEDAETILVIPDDSPLTCLLPAYHAITAMSHKTVIRDREVAINALRFVAPMLNGEYRTILSELAEDLESMEGV